MSERTFYEVWGKIESHEGKTFRTKRGLDFTYEIDGNSIIPIRDGRTVYMISKRDVEEAFSRLPLKGPGEISKLVRGPTYIWAILNDKRISLDGL